MRLLHTRAKCASILPAESYTASKDNIELIHFLERSFDRCIFAGKMMPDRSECKYLNVEITDVTSSGFLCLIMNSVEYISFTCWAIGHAGLDSIVCSSSVITNDEVWGTALGCLLWCVFTKVFPASWGLFKLFADNWCVAVLYDRHWSYIVTHFCKVSVFIGFVFDSHSDNVSSSLLQGENFSHFLSNVDHQSALRLLLKLIGFRLG